ncbi:MAG: hypothetical protein HYX96_01800 [Chloroflexi bacterium]|nr:hypothetical protein [Chloroflexota bacterium]
MRKIIFSVTAILLTLTLLAAGCAASGGSSPTPAPAGDYSSLLANLRGEGATVTEVGELEQPFFAVPGKLIRVNEQDVQVFEYDSAAAAESAASQVSADGGTIGTTMVTWVAPPHFYKAGKVIVLYVGSEQAVRDLLGKILGPQFAGR